MLTPMTSMASREQQPVDELFLWYHDQAPRSTSMINDLSKRYGVGDVRVVFDMTPTTMKSMAWFMLVRLEHVGDEIAAQRAVPRHGGVLGRALAQEERQIPRGSTTRPAYRGAAAKLRATWTGSHRFRRPDGFDAKSPPPRPRRGTPPRPLPPSRGTEQPNPEPPAAAGRRRRRPGSRTTTSPSRAISHVHGRFPRLRRLRSSAAAAGFLVRVPGGQGDVSVYGDLLVMSVEQTHGRIDCGVRACRIIGAERFRGVRSDISDVQGRSRCGHGATAIEWRHHTLVTNS